jgi:hypothetical protein
LGVDGRRSEFISVEEVVEYLVEEYADLVHVDEAMACEEGEDGAKRREDVALRSGLRPGEASYD